MKTKICTGECGKRKKLSEFHKSSSNKKDGHKSKCKVCRLINRKNQYQLDKLKPDYKEKRLKYQQIYYSKYVDNNKEKLKEYHSEYDKAYFIKNKKKINKQKLQYSNDKYKNNFEFRLTSILRARLNKAIIPNIKNRSSLEFIGCSIEQLKQHLESQFLLGMNWNNHSLHGWHIDHRIPCAKFDLSKEEEQFKCFHYTNLQPLWAKENWSKGSK